MGVSKSKEITKLYEDAGASRKCLTEEDLLVLLELYTNVECSVLELDSIVKPIVAELVANRTHNSHFKWILCHCRKMFAPIVISSSIANETQLACLSLTGLILRHVHALVQAQSTTLLELLADTSGQLNPFGERQDWGWTEAKRLCELLLDYITQVKLNAHTVATYAEVASLLLSMCSSILHHPTSPGKTGADVFVDIIISYNQLEALVRVLLIRMVEWKERPKQVTAFSRSLNESFNVGNIFSWIRGGQKDAKDVFTSETKDLANSTIQKSCNLWEGALSRLAQLLALLAVYQRGNKANPVVGYIQKLKDAEVVNFEMLLRAITVRLTDCPSLCILLYILLHDHTSFLSNVITPDFTQLLKTIQSLQELTYIVCTNANHVPEAGISHYLVRNNDKKGFGSGVAKCAPDSNRLCRFVDGMTRFSYPYVLFMTSTLLFILSQDYTINQHIFTHFSEHDFLSKRYGPGELSVGGCYLIVVSVGTLKALKDSNEELAILLASCLANLATFAHNIDSYTSQKLIMLPIAIVKRLQLIEREYQQAVEEFQKETFLEKSIDLNQASPSVCDRDALSLAKSNSMPIDQSIERIRLSGQLHILLLNIVVEALDDMLMDAGNRNNECLAYELLYHRDKIIDSVVCKDKNTNPETHRSDSSDNSGHFMLHVSELLSNLSRRIVDYEAEIAKWPRLTRRDQIIDIIRHHNQEQGAGQEMEENVKGGPSGVGLVFRNRLSMGKCLTTAVNERLPIKLNVHGSSVTHLETCQLPYRYEEHSHSYDFFGPFIWATMLNDVRLPGGTLWCTDVGELPLFSYLYS